MQLRHTNLKKLNKSATFRRRQRECEQVVEMRETRNVLFFGLLQCLRAPYWCRQLALQFLAHDVSRDRLAEILDRIAAHDLRIECYAESPIFPPRFFLLGCDVPEIALYLQLPTTSEDAADAAGIELSAIYAFLRFLKGRPWYQHTQVHPGTLLYFDLKREYELLPAQRAFVCQALLVALMRGIHWIGTRTEWAHPLVDATTSRIDRLLPKLLAH